MDDRIINYFRTKSSGILMHGCVDAVDEFSQKINKPTIEEMRDISAYYFGNCELFRINCQAFVAAD